MGVLITRFKAKTQFKLDLTGTATGTELGNNICCEWTHSFAFSDREIFSVLRV